MTPYLDYLNSLINKIEAEHSLHPSPIYWLSPYDDSHDGERRKLLADLEGALSWDFKKTKPWLNSLSRGCRICGEGEWSCIFITGMCNAKCFYCPASQLFDEQPQSQRLLFSEPEAYADYINEFGFKGVAFSGGEPLMVPERALAFISTVRRRCSPSLHIWMYTNGILGNEARYGELAEAGLDELRFDIGAMGYSLVALKGASVIPNLTVEIPAIPEEVDRLKSLCEPLWEAGVTNLNLHQLRLTTYNAPKLLQKRYTYLHGEAATVLESELAALLVMSHVAEKGLPLGVNYCNFQFKNRFQKAGFRRVMARKLVKENEEVTENGFLRSVTQGMGDEPHAVPFHALNTSEPATFTYRGRVLENLTTPQPGARQYTIKGHSFPIKEGLPGHPIRLTSEQIVKMREMIAQEGEIIPDDPLLYEIWRMECIESGLREWF